MEEKEDIEKASVSEVKLKKVLFKKKPFSVSQTINIIVLICSVFNIGWLFLPNMLVESYSKPISCFDLIKVMFAEPSNATPQNLIMSNAQLKTWGMLLIIGGVMVAVCCVILLVMSLINIVNKKEIVNQYCTWANLIGAVIAFAGGIGAVVVWNSMATMYVGSKLAWGLFVMFGCSLLAFLATMFPYLLIKPKKEKETNNQ